MPVFGSSPDPFAGSTPVGGERVQGTPPLFDLRPYIYGDEAAREDEVVPPEYEIRFRSTDYPVDALVERLRTGRMVVPEFQRSFVWPRAHAERFIESLLLGLPVPAIFLAQNPDKRQLLVVDGHQRLATILAFYDGILDGEPFALESVTSRFRHQSYATLGEADRARLDDAVITGNVLRQEEPADDFSSVYFVFERLNTGSMPLTRHEIRRAVNPGPLRDFIDEVSVEAAWERLVSSVRNPGGTLAPEQRSRAQELVLRWLAFWQAREDYSHAAAVVQGRRADGPARENHSVKLFLDRFMARNRDVNAATVDRWRRRFHEVVQIAAPAAGSARGFAPNAAMFEAMLVALTEAARPDRAAPGFSALGSDNDFRQLTKEFTSRLDAVEQRYTYAANVIAQMSERVGD